MISADVFFIAVETSLPLGRAVSYLSAIGESLDFILFEMSETMSFLQEGIQQLCFFKFFKCKLEARKTKLIA